jgi:hypothetical protein
MIDPFLESTRGKMACFHSKIPPGFHGVAILAISETLAAMATGDQFLPKIS